MPKAGDNNVIIISGAGIAGLTAALCFAQKGFQVEIVEQAEVLEKIGAGIQLSPNAYGILDQLGLGEALERHASFPDAVQIHDGKSGNVVTSIPLGDTIRDKFRQPYCVIHRGDLQDILLAACQAHKSINLTFGAVVTNVERSTIAVCADVSDRSKSLEGQALVVADGVWSKLRTEVLKLAPPTYSGKSAWRGLIPAAEVSNPDLMGDTHLWLRPNSHAVTYPVQGGSFLNVIVIVNDTAGTARRANNIANECSGFGGELGDLLQGNAEWSSWPLYTTPRPIQFGHERVALIGDAAHAMLPFAAQGAAMAIEDAAVLTDCISITSATTGIAAYDQAREDRIKKVMQLAKANGMIYHLPWPLNICRNFAMRRLPGARMIDGLSWLYDWKPGD